MISGFTPDAFLEQAGGGSERHPSDEAGMLDRFAQFAAVAAREAIADSGRLHTRRHLNARDWTAKRESGSIYPRVPGRFCREPPRYRCRGNRGPAHGLLPTTSM